MTVIYRTALGQDSHRFSDHSLAGQDQSASFSNADETKPLRIAGIDIGNAPKLEANSDGDVVLHAVTNAISGITTKNVIGKRADDLCKQGITDSRAYLNLALDDLAEMKTVKLLHLSLSIEALRPKLSPYMDEMRQSLADLLDLPPSSIGITATTGEQLSGAGNGAGIAVLCVLTAAEEVE